MDAVKFMAEFNRMCESYGQYECGECPLAVKDNYCFEPMILPKYKEAYSDVVAVVEKWSRENPEEIGKKYIIEVDGVNKDGHCHTCIGWLSKLQIEMLEEYKESEE